MTTSNYAAYKIWDRGIRWFHWINFFSVLCLLASGLVIYNGKALGLVGEAKIGMKVLHTTFGYVLAANLLWRIVQAFTGSRFSRWSAILPGKGFIGELVDYVKSLRGGEPRYYLGHNPLGRLMVLALLVLLGAQAVTGLVLAGTDIYYPPLGAWIAEWVAPAGVDPSTLVPGNKAMVDAAAWDAMRSFRKPFGEVHESIFFLLCIAIVLHIAGVVMGEIRERAGLVSAMFSGQKVLPKKPVDLEEK